MNTSTPSQNKWILVAIISTITLFVICCLCLLALSAAGLLTIWNFTSEPAGPASGQPIISLTPHALPVQPAKSTPTIQVQEPASTSTPAAQPNPSPTFPQPASVEDSTSQAAAAETLKTLEQAIIPTSDPADLAMRFEGKTGIPLTLEPPAFPLQIGDRQSFWVSNSDTNESFQVDAALRHITDHAYFWIEEGVSYRERDLRNLAEAFENQIYPTNRAFFGNEWSPGVDGDTRLYILYAGNLGSGIAGYFSTIDSLNPAIMEYSNGHEMFVFNADSMGLRAKYTQGVLAHEFQHMIHWYRDRNEDSWVNEGFSDLAMFLNGYDIGGHDYVYALDPDMQLNTWPADSNETSPHYGSSFLFINYFLDRFGEQATQALVSHPGNGLNGIDSLLAELDVRDPLSGQPVQADDVFADWVLASYLQDEDVADGRYTYKNYPDAPQPIETEYDRTCSDQPQVREVHQYGVDYIRLRCRGSVTLRFEGATETSLLPANPHSGKYAFWSNQGDESSISLTQSFDFSAVNTPLMLRYWTWYDIEKDFDYLYLLASEDGVRWEIVHTPSGTGEDPTGANYGWGYSGLSAGEPAWIQEEVDLSRFAGQRVMLRFEYITDGAVNGEGFLLDDISIPAIGYSSDFELDNGGWLPEGFVRIQNYLPQTYRVALIRQDRETTVMNVTLGEGNVAEISLDFDQGLDEAVLVVSGTTRYTRQTAFYTYSFR